MDRVLFEMPTADVPQWIPCSERLPKAPTFCLVTTDGSHNDVIDIAMYMSDGWHKASKVLAWMPLPKPWKGEKMTNDEAKEGLYRILENYYRVCNEHLLKEIDVAEEINSLNMAIEALEKYEEAYEHGWTDAECKYREILRRKHGEMEESNEI